MPKTEKSYLHDQLLAKHGHHVHAYIRTRYTKREGRILQCSSTVRLTPDHCIALLDVATFVFFIASPYIKKGKKSLYNIMGHPLFLLRVHQDQWPAISSFTGAKDVFFQNLHRSITWKIATKV